MRHRFAGSLGVNDVKQHFAHRFSVPDDATELTIRCEYVPERTASGLNALHLTLFDAHGFRGAGHRRGDVQESVVTHLVTLSAAQATPGYLIGPVPAGEWTVVIDTHMILPEAPVTYRLTIDIWREPVAAVDPPIATAAVPLGGPAWYRGDLHGHTVHSDGSWHPDDIVDYATQHHLDFVTLTDHNTISALAEFDGLARSDLLTMGGLELTTYYGHALALGVRRWIDWRIQPGVRTMPQIATEVADAGGLFVVAHPVCVGDPTCTGCDWRYSDMLPGPARCIEVWNGYAWESESNNENALALWYVWLNHGYRMMATTGTDIHGPLPLGVCPAFNVVYAPSLSETAILGAIAQGHLYISNGPTLEITGHGESGEVAIMGDCLPDGDATIAARWGGNASDDRIRLIGDGAVLYDQQANAEEQHQWSVDAHQAHWYVLELRDVTGRLRAVTNPIFIGTPVPNR